MSKLKLVIVDLDQTLIDTSGLDSHRQQAMKTHKWKGVLQNLHLAKVFRTSGGILPHELPANWRQQGLKVAVVTNAIETVAKQLLQNFRIPHDFLVSYHDTTAHKPEPEPFLHALELCGVSADEAISVGDDWGDSQAAHTAEIFSVGAGWGISNWNRFASYAPEVCVYEPNELVPIRDFSSRRYLGDVIFAEGSAYTPHTGSVIWLGPNKSNGFCIGRYFPTWDERHATNGLTKAIIQAKDDADEMATFAPTVIAALESQDLLEKFKYVVAVPAREDEESRFTGLLRELQESKKFTSYQDGLTCEGDYPSIKGLGPVERKDAVSGQFSTTYSWKRNGVILIDDVLTTGSTASECARVLLNSGAREVIVVALGKDQSIRNKKVCPRCSRRLNVRHGKRGDFWGCEGYSDRANQCTYTESLAVTVG